MKSERSLRLERSRNLRKKESNSPTYLENNTAWPVATPRRDFGPKISRINPSPRNCNEDSSAINLNFRISRTTKRRAMSRLSRKRRKSMSSKRKKRFYRILKSSVIVENSWAPAVAFTHNENITQPHLAARVSNP